MMTDEQIKHELKRFGDKAEEGTILVREQRYGVDQFIWCNPEEKPWIGSSRYTPYAAKCREGRVALMPFPQGYLDEPEIKTRRDWF